ncbi:MAG: hypothetical protein P1P89_14425 [Desulfobacterales bacterium]|nr:hypothetical protein [Desulfobacterales bacterium]
MKITLSKDQKGLLGLTGHIGVGHVHSHSGFVQEDGAGFAVVSKIINEAAPVDLRIAHVEVVSENGCITVKLKGGGAGTINARSGITPAEVALMQNAVGKDGFCPQTLATTIFGRINGQGVLEVPNAFITATAIAVLNTFLQNYPDQFSIVTEDTPMSAGCTMGTVLQIDEMSVSTMLTVNAGEGGIGPNEDTEGNVPIGNKGKLMRKLGMDCLPTIIVEAKAYVPFWKEFIKETTLIVRANEIHDNTVVGECIVKAAENLGYPVFQPKQPYPRKIGSLAKATQDVAGRIVDFGNGFAKAKTAGEKNLIAAQLAMLVKHDLGGVTFMSDEVNNVVDNGGLLPGTAAVLSSAVTSSYAAHYQIPVLCEHDVDMYRNTIIEAFRLLRHRLVEAKEQLQERAVPAERIKYMEQIALKKKSRPLKN